jgi:hypothetical protein
MIDKTIKKINANLVTYNSYVEQGLWKPTTKVIFDRGISGKVTADVKVKGRVKMIPAIILITDYFYSEMYKDYCGK